MNHDAISTALCGRYTKLSPTSGYLESIFPARGDGGLVGAYIIDAGRGSLLVTDDGDTLFDAVANCSVVTPGRTRSYKRLAETNGVKLTDEGALLVKAEEASLPAALSMYFRTVLAISDLAFKHRPSDTDRFIRTVGADLAHFGKRLVSRPMMTGLSGHQLAFHFGIDIAREDAVMIQTIAAIDGGLKWGDVYETGGKFKDAKAARSHLRLVAVLEDARDADKASSFLADVADVHIYRGRPLALAA